MQANGGLRMRIMCITCDGKKPCRCGSSARRRCAHAVLIFYVVCAAPISVEGHPITMGSEVHSAAGSPIGSVQGHPITFQSGSELGSPIGSATGSPLGGVPPPKLRRMWRCLMPAPASLGVTGCL